MKFFEIHSPYYALIKAADFEKAKIEYVNSVTDDDGTIVNELSEVSRDYALIKFSQTADEQGKLPDLNETIQEFNNETPTILLLDYQLI